MGSKSNIEWTDASWTPIRARNLKTEKVGWHCEHVTTGCEFCYAERMNKRLGTGLSFKPGYRKDIEIFLDREMLLAPLRWKSPRRIFVCSMTDAFADFVKDEWLDKIFAVMALCPQHTFQVLTKRGERMRDYCHGLQQEELDESIEAIMPFTMARVIHRPLGSPALPLRNVWLGVSCERQQEADERIPLLLQTPAAVRFISAEPLLGLIDLQTIMVASCHSEFPNGEPALANLDWVIVGGESGGHDARPFKIEWADEIIEQCRDANVACFVKQLGSFPTSDGYPLELRSRKGGDESEWPMRLNVRQFPQAAARGSPMVTVKDQEQKLSADI